MNRKSHVKGGPRSKLPKGAYPLPSGGYVTEQVITTKSGRRVKVRFFNRAKPDLELLAKAIVQQAIDETNGKHRADDAEPPATSSLPPAS